MKEAKIGQTISRQNYCEQEFNSLRWQVYMYNEIFPNVYHIEKA